MQLEAKDFLRLVENNKSIVFWDLESTGLGGDYNSLLVSAVKPYLKKALCEAVTKPGDDRKLCSWSKELLEAADCWVTYYGKGFDIKILNSRLLKWGLMPVEKRPHLDMYFMLKSRLATGRRSQAHLCEWLKLPEQKMSVSADVWAAHASDWDNSREVLVKRCISDVKGLEALYKRTKQLVGDVKR